MAKTTKPTQTLIDHIEIFLMGLGDKYHFINMARCGNNQEKTAWNQKCVSFDLARINSDLSWDNSSLLNVETIYFNQDVTEIFFQS